MRWCFISVVNKKVNFKERHIASLLKGSSSVALALTANSSWMLCGSQTAYTWSGRCYTGHAFFWSCSWRPVRV